MTDKVDSRVSAQRSKRPRETPEQVREAGLPKRKVR